MAPSNKSSSTSTASRRKSNKGMLILKLSPKALQSLGTPNAVKETNLKSPSIVDRTSSSPSTGDKKLGSNIHTPVQPETPGSSSMPPPTESLKKKGNKRAAAGTDGNSKARGRPGPKKKARLDDGTLNHTSATPRAPNGSAVKLGPKANQGAINAGLRALDRSGKPCRKWAKGSFKLKSFTGITWEIPRWKAPLHIVAIHSSSKTISGETLKKNQNSIQVESLPGENSNSVIDFEMESLNSHSASSSIPHLTPSGEALTSTQSSPVAASA
ncbi:hypothetical protein K3495_g2803 [Podosphaera aphanis]|nr:hypothetical protein K3495_g2803 [Podosphaera aphanis]